MGGCLRGVKFTGQAYTRLAIDWGSFPMGSRTQVGERHFFR